MLMSSQQNISYVIKKGTLLLISVVCSDLFVNCITTTWQNLQLWNIVWYWTKVYCKHHGTWYIYNPTYINWQTIHCHVMRCLKINVSAQNMVASIDICVLKACNATRISDPPTEQLFVILQPLSNGIYTFLLLLSLEWGTEVLWQLISSTTQSINQRLKANLLILWNHTLIADQAHILCVKEITQLLLRLYLVAHNLTDFQKTAHLSWLQNRKDMLLLKLHKENFQKISLVKFRNTTIKP